MSEIKTFNLIEAADFLKMSTESLRQKAASGLIPAAKPSKSWCFLLQDLEGYLRSLYAKDAKASLGDTHRSKQCHSTKEAMCGGLISAITDKEYDEQLELQTK